MASERKRCSACREVKPLGELNRNCRIADGHHYQCRMCHRTQVSKSAKRQSEDKYCPSCAVTKPRRAFHRNRSQPDGLQTQCKACHTTQAARYQARKAGRDLPPMPTRTRPYKHVAKVRPAPVDVLADVVATKTAEAVDVAIEVASAPRAPRCACGTRRGAECGFPVQGEVCGERVCASHGRSIRPGLVYCGPHYERAQEALSRRNSSR